MDNQTMEVLIGSYGEENSACIQWLQIHAESGEVQWLGEQDGIANPSFLAKHPTQKRVYAVSEVPEGEVVCYELHDDTHCLKERQRLPTHGGPCYVEVSACGGYLFVSNYSNSGVVVYALDEKGDLQEEIEYLDFTSTNNGASHIHTVRQIPGSSRILMTDIGKSKIYIYEWDKEKRRLLPFQNLTIPEKTGPRHVAFHPEKSIVYVINEYQSTVLVYQYTDQSVFLQCIQEIETVSEQKNYGAEIQYVDGKIITSNRGADSLTFFHVTEDGLLEKETSILTGGKWPRHFCSNQLLNNQLFICHQNSNNITIFKQINNTYLMKNNTISVQSPVCIIKI
ncbi:lactonase family protein [Oceanobacillus jeddahense]|uniref:Lactonase family protein n=1 Tax=Oceanobacillus jeddahense TaxID=1462527 RepID=A0ABY5JR74_9BACI|nr:beta-propeller fold lactonase family protein [Oceanobacillus jeddahense]UUI02818.1 lactonase family protein [Oceanobacillus jeddahense]